MPRPHERTRSEKRVHTTMPGGSRGTVYRKEVRTHPRCHSCGRLLAGLSHKSPKAHRLNRTQKRVFRMYGGQLCSICLRNALRQTARTV